MYLSKILMVLFVAISIFAFSTVSFAASENNIDTGSNDMYTVEAADKNSTATYSVEDMSRHHDGSNMGTVIIVAVVVSVLVTGITVIVIWSRYKTNGMTEPYPYNQKAPLRLTEADDILIDTRVTKTRINKN